MDNLLKKINKGHIIFVLYPILLFYITAFMTYNPFVRTKWRAQTLNLILFEVFAVFLLVIIGNAVIALRVEIILALVISIANYYVLSFRSSPIVPWDLFSMGTAASVAGSYNYMLPFRQIFLIALMIAMIVTARFAKLKMNRKYWLLRAAAGVVCICITCGITWVVHQEKYVNKLQLYPFLFTPTVMYERNGFVVTFLIDLQYLSVDKPEGYSKESAQELLDAQEGLSWTADTNELTDAVSTDGEKNAELPNVIVVMDEAFSDLGVLTDFTTDEDYMPFMHSLEAGAENTVTGKLNVSVKGGNTANTEYEFLTGNSMAYLPAGSIPYQQYVKNEIPSLASYFKSIGYDTYAMHPYLAAGWNRDKVYPLMGFDEFLSLDSFAGASYVRDYVDDSSCVDKIIELYGNKKTGKPAFIFNVTMQNHSPYTDGYYDSKNSISVDGTFSVQLNEYLSLIKLSDAALEKLITYFEGQEEPTVVVFFGDHQPSDTVAEPVWNLKGMHSNNLTDEQNQLRYEVPYVIWANYDIREASDVDSSANYLAAQMMEYAGIPMSQYQEYLLQTAEQMPVISTQYTEDKGSEVWNEYQILQYYLMFDYSKEDAQ